MNVAELLKEVQTSQAAKTFWHAVQDGDRFTELTSSGRRNAVVEFIQAHPQFKHFNSLLEMCVLTAGSNATAERVSRSDYAGGG